MNKFAKLYLTVITLLFSMFLVLGCSTDKVKTFKEDLVNITMNQVANQLENSLNQEFPGIQVNNNLIMNKNGKLNWSQFKQTELANYVFYSIGDYDFRAVLQGDGIFKIQRINNATNQTYSYAEFNVTMKDGKFIVEAK